MTTLSDKLIAKGGFQIPGEIQNATQLQGYLVGRGVTEETFAKNVPLFIFGEVTIHSYLFCSFTDANVDIPFDTLAKRKKTILCSDGVTIQLNGFEMEALKAKSPFFDAFFHSDLVTDSLTITSDLLLLITLPSQESRKWIEDLADPVLVDLIKYAEMYQVSDLATMAANRIHLWERSRAIGEPSPSSLDELEQFGRAILFHQLATEHLLPALKKNCEEYFSRVLERAYRSSNMQLFVDIVMRIKTLDIKTIEILPSSQSRPIVIKIPELKLEQRSQFGLSILDLTKGTGCSDWEIYPALLML